MTARPLGDGRWLVELDGRRFTVPEAVGRRCAAGRAPPELLEYCASRPRRRNLRLVLVPAGAVARAAGFLTPGASWPALGLSAVGGMWIYCVAPPPPSGAFCWPVVLGCVLASALWHELGHAAALRRGGGRPGAVGLGRLWLLPALWCDVGEVALLRTSDRVRTDLTGPAWQLGAAGALAAAGALIDRADMIAGARGALLAAIWSLLPLAGTDGTWALADAFGLRSLNAVAPPEWSRRRRRLFVGARLLAAVATVGVTVFVIGRWGRPGGGLWAGPAGCDVAAATLLAGLLGASLARTRQLVVGPCGPGSRAGGAQDSSKKSILSMGMQTVVAMFDRWPKIRL